MQISPTKSTFFLGKNFGDTRHPYEKNEPTLDHSGGGVHGKACWLIAYMLSMDIRGWLIITTITNARSFLHGMEAITKH